MKRIGLISVISLAVIIIGYFIFIQDNKLVPTPITTLIPTSSPTATNIQGTKTYKNNEFGFEFEYPEGWTFEVNSFHNPSSKFNLQGNTSAKDYNVLVPHFLLNIVTPEFADNAITSRRNRGVVESDIIIDGIIGKKFQYETGYSEKISIDTPLNKYRLILSLEIIDGFDSNKEYVSIFNQILASFKFLK